MPMLNVDIIPDVTGRNLGTPDKRYDAHIRNLDIDGALTGLEGLGGILNNDVQNTDSFSITSNTGTGGSIMRVRVPNTGGVLNPVATIRALQLAIGHETAALGGMVPLHLMSGPTDVSSYLKMYRRGQAVGGALAAEFNYQGELVNWQAGVFATAMRIFASGEAMPRFALGTDGAMSWGPGGATAPDASLERLSPGVMRLGDGLGGAAILTLSQLFSTVATGTAPFTVASTTKVDNLNADLLKGKDFTNPGAIGGSVPASGAFTTLGISGALTSSLATGTAPLVIASQTRVDNLTVQRVDAPIFTGNFPQDGEAFKHKRITTGVVTAGSRVAVSVAWTTPFLSASYTIMAVVFDSTGSTAAGLRVERITGQSATSCTIQVYNTDTVTDRTGTIHIFAVKG